MDEGGVYQLQRAIIQKRPVEEILAILEGVEDIDEQMPHTKNSTLHLVGRYGPEIVAFNLLFREGNINLRNAKKETPLHMVARYNPPGVGELFLNTEGIELNPQNIDGKTPAHFAMEYRNISMINLLAVACADFSIADNDGRSAYFYSHEDDRDEIKQIVNQVDCLEHPWTEEEEGGEQSSLIPVDKKLPPTNAFRVLGLEKEMVVITIVDKKTASVERVVNYYTAHLNQLDLVDLPNGTYLFFFDGTSKVLPVELKEGVFESREVQLENEIPSERLYLFEIGDGAIPHQYSPSASGHLTAIELQLRDKFNIVLDHGNLPWTWPVQWILFQGVNNFWPEGMPSKVQLELTDEGLNNDIEFKKEGGQWIGSLSLGAFHRGEAKLGDRKFFFPRLFQALIRLFTNDGKKKSASNKVLQKNFNLTIEKDGEFSIFTPEELLQIIIVFNDLPTPMRTNPRPILLLRRGEGLLHPIYPKASVVFDSDELEFMDNFFQLEHQQVNHTQLLHEKAHAFWQNTLSNSLQDRWKKIGKWVKRGHGKDWASYGGIYLSSPVYSLRSPQGDFAEAISLFVTNREYLQNLTPDKFAFVKDIIEGRVPTGNNFAIERIEVTTIKDTALGKDVKITIQLANLEVESGSSRIYSLNGGGHRKVSFASDSDNKNILWAVTTIPWNEEREYWTMDNLAVVDVRHHQIKIKGSHLLFKLSLEDGERDYFPPRYQSGSMNVVSFVEGEEHRRVYRLEVSWKVERSIPLKEKNPVSAQIVSLDSPGLSPIEGHGSFDEETSLASVNFILSDYYPQGRYGVSLIQMEDQSLRMGRKYFAPDMPWATIDSQNSDYSKPLLRVNQVFVEAKALEDGQVSATIAFYGRDSDSGLERAFYKLVDPSGNIYLGEFTPPYFSTEEQKYEIVKVLPHATPGVWYLSEITLRDRVGNSNSYYFSDRINFVIE